MIISAFFFIILLSSFALFWLFLGIHAARNIITSSDYFLTGNKLGVIPITLTLMATQIGGGFLSGIAQESYHTGFYGMLYALGISVGFIVLGLGVAGRLKSFAVNTTAEIFEKVYGSTFLKQCASLSFSASLFGILIAQIVTFKAIASGLDIDSAIFIILFWLSIILHTVLGGFKGVVLIDNIKQLCIIAIFSAIFVYSIFTLPEPSSWSPEILYALQKRFFTTPDSSFAHVLPTFLMPALFCLIEQDLAQCFFAARSPAVATAAAFYASIFLILFSMLPVYFGIEAKLLNVSVSTNTHPLTNFLAYHCNGIIFAFAIMALIMAITSTANSLLCSISAHVTHDFHINTAHLKGVRKAQLITLCIGLAALVSAFLVNTQILTIITTSYELSVSMLFVPLCAAYLNSTCNTSHYGAELSVLIGFISFFLNRLWPLSIARELVTLFASFCAFCVGYCMKKRSIL